MANEVAELLYLLQCAEPAMMNCPPRDRVRETLRAYAQRESHAPKHMPAANETVLQSTNQAIMTPKQYADAIERLGLSQRAAGAFFGVDERQSRRWIAGDSAIPESVAKLLRLMIKLSLKPDDVR